MKTFFSNIPTKKAVTVTIVAAFLVGTCFFLGVYFYAKYWESQLQEGIHIGDFSLSAEQAEISFLQGIVDIKNLRAHDLKNKEGSFFSIQKIYISGIPMFSFTRSDTLLLAKKVTLAGIKGRYYEHNNSVTIGLKGASFGEVWGSPNLLFSNDSKDIAPALLSLSFRATWLFGLTGKYSRSGSLHEVSHLAIVSGSSDSTREMPSLLEQKKSTSVEESDMHSSVVAFEQKKDFAQNRKISEEIFSELMQKISKHASWDMEFAKVEFFSLSSIDNASFSNIHIMFEKEEVASLAQLEIQQADYAAIGLGLPFSNLKELTLERLRFPNKKDGAITLARAEVNAALLFNGMSLDFSLHELSFPKKISPFPFQGLFKSVSLKKHMLRDAYETQLSVHNSFDKHTVDTSFQGSLSLADKDEQKEALCAWEANAFTFRFADVGTLSGKGSGFLYDTIDSLIQVNFLDAKFSDTLGGSLHRIVKEPTRLDKRLFYWLIMGEANSKVY